jgi:hypothetical protein
MTVILLSTKQAIEGTGPTSMESIARAIKDVYGQLPSINNNNNILLGPENTSNNMLVDEKKKTEKNMLKES